MGVSQYLVDHIEADAPSHQSLSHRPAIAVRRDRAAADCAIQSKHVAAKNGSLHRIARTIPKDGTVAVQDDQRPNHRCGRRRDVDNSTAIALDYQLQSITVIIDMAAFARQKFGCIGPG